MTTGDSGVGINEGTGIRIATHAFNEDGEERHAQRVAPGTGIYEQLFVETDINGPGWVGSDFVEVEGKARIALTAYFPTACTDTSIDFIVALKDSTTGHTGFTTTVSLAKTPVADGTDGYFGEFVILANDFGANLMRIYVTSTNTGVTINCGVL